VLRWTTKVGLGVLVLLLAIQMIPVSPSNPPVEPARTIYSIQAVPEPVKEVFSQSCNNCHSDETEWPWYSHIAPMSWLISRDVRRARGVINLSQWGTYSVKQRQEKLEDICEQLANGEMPERRYLLFHHDARVTQSQRKVVCDWTDDAREY